MISKQDARWTRIVLERIRKVMPGLHGTIPHFLVVGASAEGADLREALHVAEEAARPGQAPIVVAYEGDGAAPIVVMRMPHFLELIMAWWQIRAGGAYTNKP